MKNFKSVIILVLIASNMWFAFWGLSQYIERLGVNTVKTERASKRNTREYMPVAESYFLERKEEFEALSKIIENKQSTYSFYVDYSGVWNSFVKCKESISIPTSFVSLYR